MNHLFLPAGKSAQILFVLLTQVICVGRSHGHIGGQKKCVIGQSREKRRISTTHTIILFRCCHPLPSAAIRASATLHHQILSYFRRRPPLYPPPSATLFRHPPLVPNVNRRPPLSADIRAVRRLPLPPPIAIRPHFIRPQHPPLFCHPCPPPSL
jgi:hypothetical protein